jgi:acetyltransferase-like isoleucine patch superfamily enzyme
MSVSSRMARIRDRILGKRFGLRALRAQLDIDPTARLEEQFTVNFLAAPEERVYVRIGKEVMTSVSIVFESRQGMVEIGDRTNMGGGCSIISRERVTIGNDVMMSSGICIYDHNSNPFDWRLRSKMGQHFYQNYGKPGCYEAIDWTGVKSAPIEIQDKVWIGFDVVILKGVRVGEGAIVGARAVVTKDVEPYTVVAGNPARVVRRLDQEA